jgi:hypothetical protein
MAAGQITIGIAGGSSTNFTTSAIPSLVLAKTAGILSNRLPQNPLTIAGRSSYGTLSVDGTSYATKYGWEINAVLTVDEMLILEDLLEWQKGNPTAGLRLIDEVEYLRPAVSHTRTLLTPIAPDWNLSKTYGYAVFQVIITVGDNWKERIGRFREGKQSVTLGAEEL